MISKSSIDNLVAWRKDTVSRLAQIQKEEGLIREVSRMSANATREARFKGRSITWEDQAAVLEMLEAVITGVSHMLTVRSADLERLLENIDKLALTELPPGVAWEWPSSTETAEH